MRLISNLELYKVFYLAAKTGSFTKAAQALYITQPSVSHAVKQLEDNFGSALFERTPKGVKLTNEGEVLFAYIEQAFAYIVMAEERMQSIKNLNSGDIRIGGSDSLFKHYLLPHIETFRQQHGSINFHLTHGTTPEIIALLKEGAIDFGVVRLPISDAQLEVRGSISLQECFVAGPRYSELRGVTLSLQEMLEYPLILFSRNSRARTAVTGLFEEYGLLLVPEIEVGSVDLLIEFARKGLGISYVTKQFVSKELENGELFEVLTDISLPPSRAGMISLKNMPLSNAARTFLEQIF